MTKAQMHEFFKEFTYDPATFAEQSELTPYVYDQQSVDAYYEKCKAQGKLHFAILRADAVIGDLYLKHIDYDKRTCELGIHMVNDRVKNKGYGTKSIQLLLSHAFTELEMESGAPSETLYTAFLTDPEESIAFSSSALMSILLFSSIMCSVFAKELLSIIAPAPSI